MNPLFTTGVRAKLFTLLIALTAVTGLVAAGCGSSDSGGRVEVSTESPGPVAGESASPSPVADETATPDEPEVIFLTSEITFDRSLTCAEQFPASEEETIQTAEAMLDRIQAAFPNITEAQARTLALAFSLCQVDFSEVENLLADGELGSQFRNMLAAVSLDDFASFIELYRDQACLVASYDGDVEIESTSRLNRLIGAASTAALIQFVPTDEEIEALADRFIDEALQAIFDQVIEGNAVESNSTQDTDGETGDSLTIQLTCEMVVERFVQQGEQLEN